MNMELLDFASLSDEVYEFITYMDEKIIGIPKSIYDSGIQKSFIIPSEKIIEFNSSNQSIADKVKAGLLVPINPDVIDLFKRIS